MLKNCISDKGIKSPHHLCDRAGMIFVENLDLRVMAKGMLGKHILDAGLEPFVNPILPWVYSKRDLYDGTVDARGTSENCPDCGAEVGKDLSVRVRHCRNYGSANPNDIASDRVISAREQRVVENACEGEAAGVRDTQSSWHLSKPEIFEAIRGISLYTC
jgi:putative transposase